MKSDVTQRLPDYDGACVANIVPELFGLTPKPAAWMPPAAFDADQVVLLVLDGLGWHQLQDRAARAPVMAAMAGQAITSVVPTTTATALTSITTGLAPGEHGVVGYRIAVENNVLNVLRWTTPAGDARSTIPPQEFQKAAAFNGERPVVVGRSEFATSGFTAAHMDGVRMVGYRGTSTMVVETRRALQSGEPFVYAYYDGLDRVGHEYGLVEHFDAEVAYCDRLVADLLSVMPKGSALVITADHGQVHTGNNVVDLPNSVTEHVALQSGEARFRWLHARPGRSSALLDAARATLGQHAWVKTREELIAKGWFGASVTVESYGRLGDVALIARGTVAFNDPNDTGPYQLVGRHGSVTEAEMMVPLLVATV